LGIDGFNGMKYVHMYIIIQDFTICPETREWVKSEYNV